MRTARTVKAETSWRRFKMTSSRMHGRFRLHLSLILFADTFFGTLEAYTRVPILNYRPRQESSLGTP